MKMKGAVIGLVIALALLTAACPNRVNISEIQANPAKYADKEIAIAGTVSNSFGVALLGGIYKVDDGTGSLWVLTNRGVPTNGARVVVRGKVQQGVSFSGRSYGLGMIESRRDSK